MAVYDYEEDIQTLKSQLDNDGEYIQVIVARAEEAEKRAKEYKEKAEKYQILKDKWDYVHYHCPEFSDFERLKDDASKWRSLGCSACKTKAELDSILDELEVEGKCVCTEIFRSEPCNDCNDNGHITREATVEDVKEVITQLFSEPLAENEEWSDFSKIGFTLKSGEILRRKNS